VVQAVVQAMVALLAVEHQVKEMQAVLLLHTTAVVEAAAERVQ
jgi:hypothetical protein